MKISENLLSLLDKNGLSQREFAERLGLSKVSLNRWIKGKTKPNSAALARIAKYFGVSVAELCGGEGDNQKIITKVSGGEDYWRQRAEAAEAALRACTESTGEQLDADEYLRRLRSSVRFVVNFIVSDAEPWASPPRDTSTPPEK